MARGDPGNMAELPKKRPCGPVGGRQMGSGLSPGAAASHSGVGPGFLCPPHPLPKPELAGLAARIYIHSQGDGVLSPLLAYFLIPRATLWTYLSSPSLSFFFCPMGIHSSTSRLLTMPDLIPGFVHSESLCTSTLPDLGESDGGSLAAMLPF